jgi:hypothetical protein
MAATATCDDCIVPVLLGGEPDGSVDLGVALDAGEAATLRLLQQAGLAPALRHARPGPVLAGRGGRG